MDAERVTESVLASLRLPVLRARLTMRLLADSPLPEHKGAMLRGGFGYAFQRISCPEPCWTSPDACGVSELCPFRQVFATPRPPGAAELQHMQEIPRPFVIEPPADTRMDYRAGESLEFGLVIIGRAIAELPSFLAAFEQLGRMGLGRAHARARLERVEVLRPWQPIGSVIYQDGRLATSGDDLPIMQLSTSSARARELPGTLRLTLRTPLRLKFRSDILRRFDLAALVRGACWRLEALAAFHGQAPWPVSHHPLVDRARQVAVAQPQVRWLDLLRTSTRHAEPETMPQGGLVGSVLLRDVDVDLRALLLAGSQVHVGKACTFGHGGYSVEGA